MAPKKNTEKKANAADRAAAAAAQQLAEQKKKDQMNMVNQLKQAQAKDSQCEKARILDMYQNSKLQSPFKSEILQKWLQDKSCKWANEYLQVRTETIEKTDDAHVGHGTVCLMLIWARV